MEPQSVYSACMAEKKCQNKCKLDQVTYICLGCGKTLKEIVSAGNSQRKNGKKKKAA
jgi:predicted Fe-S protein YdhL (DUF1289 family)